MITQKDIGASVRLANGLISLEFDKAAGRWVSLTDESDGVRLMHAGDLLSPLLLTVGGRTLGTRGFNQMFTLADAQTVGLAWESISHEVHQEDGAAWFVSKMREGGWRVEIHTGLRDETRRIERRVVIEYAGVGEALLRNFTLRMPFADIGPADECFIEAPGHPVRAGSRVSSLWHGAWGALVEGAFNDSPAWRPPFVGLHHPETPRSLASWAWTETEPFFPRAERAPEGMLFSHKVYLADRFTNGHSLSWGSQYLEVFSTEWLDALAQLQRFYDEVGLTVPADTPDTEFKSPPKEALSSAWARAINLYEVHVGTLAPTNLAPYPTYEPLIADLPKIKEKGYDAVYIMPHVPYPSYSVIDYKDMEIQQGSETGFRDFIAKAHEIGLKVLMDVTLHGVMDRRARRSMSGRSSSSYPMEPSMPEDHPYLAGKPEWFSKNEHGEVAMTYTYSFDQASPSWQDFMVDVFTYYVREYDVDGFRVDSHTWNFFPNWAQNLGRPASASFYGSAQLFKGVREAVAAVKPGVVFYTETAGPLLHGSHELGYNYDETWMLVSILPMKTRHGILCHGLQTWHVSSWHISAWDMARWLTERRLAMPRGAIKLRSLDNHDTYWPSHEFRRETFGVDAAKAIVALFAFLDGGFMDYNGADQGCEEFYRKVVSLRKSLPVLKEGTCDYVAVKPSDPMVFAPLWEHAGRYLLPVIHFADGDATVTLPLPVVKLANSAGRYRVFDHMAEAALPSPAGGLWSADDLGDLTIDIGRYGVLLLDFAPSG